MNSRVNENTEKRLAYHETTANVEMSRIGTLHPHTHTHRYINTGRVSLWKHCDFQVTSLDLVISERKSGESRTMTVTDREFSQSIFVFSFLSFFAIILSDLYYILLDRACFLFFLSLSLGYYHLGCIMHAVFLVHQCLLKCMSTMLRRVLPSIIVWY